MDSTYCLLVFILFSNSLVLSKAKPEYEALPIIAGDETPADEFKYVVGINCDENGCSCTGSIIGERFIVSAAHCFFGDAESYKIVAGVNDVSDLENPNRVERDVERVYVPLTFNHDCPDDIAVMKLREDLQIQAHNLTKLRLPTKTRSRFAGQQAVLLGFGVSKITYTVRRDGSVDESGHPNLKLHSANVAIVANDKCDNPCISNTNLCGQMIKEDGTKHYGGCGGDSGGPLVYKSKVLIGVHTHGPAACNERFNFGIYQRVKSYIDFIDKAMKDDVEYLMYKDFPQTV